MLKLISKIRSNGNNNSTTVEEEPLTVSEWNKELWRNRFSKYLPWVAYDSEQGIYYCDHDGGYSSIGYIWECLPVLFLSEQDTKSLQGIFRLSLPDNSLLQFILIADPYVKPILTLYEEMKKGAPEHIQEAFKSLSNFYLKQSEKGQIPTRIFRLFVTLKIYKEDLNRVNLKDVKSSIEETLASVGFVPRLVPPSILFNLLRRLFNDYSSLPEDESVWGNWCNYTELRKQIIMANTEIEKQGSELRVGSKYYRCITPKSLPVEIDFLWANKLTGSYEGIAGDISQIHVPFMYTLNIVFKDLKAKLHAKASLTLNQTAFGSMIAGLKRRQEEFFWATDLLEKGDRFFEIIPIFWVFSNDAHKAREAIFRAKRIWESTGAVMQEDSTLLLPLFIYSLPFGYISHNKNNEKLDRYFMVPGETLTPMVPVQTDYMGTGVPALLFIGRKGQVIGIDIFHRKASNNNFFIVAPSGKGKSFTANYILGNYYGMGAKIRVVDIGRSYLKLCHMFQGRLVNFNPDSNICLNPFTTIKEPEYDIPAIAAIIQMMVSVQTGKLSGSNPETVLTLIQSGVKWAYSQKGNDATIQDVYTYLSKFPNLDPELDDILCEEKEACATDFQLIATHTAFNLSKYCQGGAYAKWFIGRATLDLSQDKFVVLELEEIKAQPDLFQVVVLLVMYLMTSELYLGDRSTPYILLFDESYMFLTDNQAMKRVIEEGYRRARKYRGSFGVITQSVLDFEQFGSVGRVINENSEFKFFLESGIFELAREKKLISYDPFTMSILKSIKYNAPRYSELFLHSDTFGAGVVRLSADPYTYYMYTSNPKEIAEIEDLVSQGMSYKEAINTMIQKYRKEDT